MFKVNFAWTPTVDPSGLTLVRPLLVEHLLRLQPPKLPLKRKRRLERRKSQLSKKNPKKSRLPLLLQLVTKITQSLRSKFSHWFPREPSITQRL